MLEYPLLALTQQKKCSKVTFPIVSGSVPETRIFRNVSITLVYCTKKNHDLGCHNIYTKQGIVQVHSILEHTWQKIGTVKLIQTSLEYAKLKV